jgi:hypothetical protein
MMRRALALLAGPALLVSGVAWAQIAPGFRAPADVATAIRQSVTAGCFLAVYGRPFAGISSDFSLAGPSMHPGGEIPEAMKSVTNADTRVAVFDAPGGAAWIFFDTKRRRCSVVPSPVDTAGIEAIAIDAFAPHDDWKPVKDKPGMSELKLGDEPTIRGWYQPASDGRPQMIIMEPEQ